MDGLAFDVYTKEINLIVATDIWGSFVTVTCYLTYPTWCIQQGLKGGKKSKWNRLFLPDSSHLPASIIPGHIYFPISLMKKSFNPTLWLLGFYSEEVENLFSKVHMIIHPKIGHWSHVVDSTSVEIERSAGMWWSAGGESPGVLHHLTVIILFISCAKFSQHKCAYFRVTTE